MAAKGSVVDKKRKASSSIKDKPKATSKKPRVEEKDEEMPDADADSFESFDDLSDSDDGGVKLDDDQEDSKQNGGKTFEREPGQTSRESHAKQKQLQQERKAAKPLADEVHRTKKIWERLRIKSSVPKDERQVLVDELFTIITGRMRDFVLKHDAVRAVQTAIKYSTLTQRKEIAKELQGAYPQLAESRYAKFLIGKLLVQTDDEIRDMIIPEFYGKVRKLINHPEASWILDDIYRTMATKEQKAFLLREWYGPEFAIKGMVQDTKPTADLKQILENEPGKRGPIMKSLFDMINTLVQKQMTGFTMLHDAMLQYYLNTQTGTEEFSEFLELVKGDESGDLLKNLAFTRSGSRLVCLLLAHGTAKDRKQLLKAYKDHFLMMSADPNAYIVILTAYDVIDDTKLTSKGIFPELLGDQEETITQNVLAAANNFFGRIAILYLLEGMSKLLFPVAQASDVEILKEVHEIRKTTSKKDPETRRKELVAAMSPHLLKAIAAAPADFTSTNFGCQFVANVLLSCDGDKQEALEAVAQCAGGPPNEVVEVAEGDVAPSAVHIAQHAGGSRMLKSLIQGGRFDKSAGKVIPVEPPLLFANTLYPVISEHVADWATGPGSFVIVGMAEASDFDEIDALKKTLRKNKKLLEKAATEATAEQKAAREAEEKEQEEEQAAGGKKKGKKGRRERPVGNMGSKILLESL